MGEGNGIAGMERVSDELVLTVLKQESRTGYTLIIYPAIIEAAKRNPHMTCPGFNGYRPVLATLKKSGFSISYELKERNDNGGKLATVRF